MGLNASRLQSIQAYIPMNGNVLTIGRQRVGIPGSNNALFLDEWVRKNDLKVNVKSLDLSPKEHVDIIQDLNEPIYQSNIAHKASFDVIIDSGSLEHIFNVPQALKTYNDLLKVGGHIYFIIPANNHFGHGFYQFSSDLFFRWFSPERGYYPCDSFLECKKVGLFGNKMLFYEVNDPRKFKSRTEFTNKYPVFMHFVACKSADSQGDISIIQSDYSESAESVDGGNGQEVRSRKPLKEAFRTDCVMGIYRFYGLHGRRLGRNGAFPRRGSVRKGNHESNS